MKTSVRAILLFVFAGLLALPAWRAPLAMPPASEVTVSDSEITPRINRTIKRGLAYLASTQEDDGSWRNLVGRKISDTYSPNTDSNTIHDKNVGVTALAAIAFMAHGDVPGRGTYGHNVTKALEFIVSCLKPATGFIRCQHSRMYEHAFATLALGEAYGMTNQETFPSRVKIGRALRAAIGQIITAQNRHGAWRYLPQATDSDISVTVTTLMALRAARNAGIYIPRSTIDRAVDYVRMSATAPDGGFWYQIIEIQSGRLSRHSYALTAAGVASLMYAGDYDSKQVQRGIRYLETPWRKPDAREMHTTFEYFYGQYYAAQAFFQVGGRKWRAWYEDIAWDLIKGQHEDGRWEDIVGPNYATAMACIILSMPYRYLPLFVR